MKIRKAVTGVWCLVAASTLLLTGCKDEPQPPVIVVSKVPALMLWDVHKTFKDCEDTLKTPCVTFDDGKWRKVLSYHPYASTVIKKPRKVKGGYKLR